MSLDPRLRLRPLHSAFGGLARLRLRRHLRRQTDVGQTSGKNIPDHSENHPDLDFASPSVRRGERGAELTANKKSGALAPPFFTLSED